MGKLVVLVVLAIVGIGIPAAAAGATTSVVSITSCGQVITTSAVLRTDLNCAGDGLIIEGSDLSVRLEGHTITSSNGTGMGIRFGVPAVETAPFCFDDVTIRGGTIAGFFGGISENCFSGTGNLVSGVTLRNNTWGVYALGSSLALDHTTIVGPNGVGPKGTAPGARGMVSVTHSTIDVTSPIGYALADTAMSVDSTHIEGGTVWFVDDEDLMLSNSQLRQVTVFCSNAGFAISNSRLIDSTVSGTEICGVSLTQDRITGPGSGVFLSLQSRQFQASLTGNEFSGWDVAVNVTAAWDLSITSNTFRNNVSGVTCSGCLGGGTVSENRFVDNTGTGLQIIGGDQKGDWTIGSNVALRNSGLGIDAEPSPGFTITDSGGNVARHNQPPQCTGVACTR